MKLNDLQHTQWVLARRAEKMNPSVIREILKVTERPGIISFAGGLPSPASPLLRVLAPVDVEIGDVSVTPEFAGLTPGLAGVYQVNLVVPLTLATRVYPLRVSAKGNFSNTLNIQVQGRNP